jgi:endoglucanase
MGSSWARLPDRAGGHPVGAAGNGRVPTVAFAGHIDEIGLHVTHISEQGLLHVGQVGGWDTTVLVGQRVILVTAGGPLPGVIARKPVHLLEREDRERAPKMSELQIDIGARSAAEAAERVRIGDMAVIDASPLELPGGTVVSRAIDNRVGCYVAARALELVAQAGGAPCSVLGLAVAQEETVLGGSTTSAFRHDPDVVITIDTAPETDQPGVELGEITANTFGSGPSLGRGSALHPGVFELLHETARAQEIPCTITSYGRQTGTDADAFHRARAGIPTALVEVPIRYMHTPVEMVALDDVEATAQLLAAFAQRFSSAVSLERTAADNRA